MTKKYILLSTLLFCRIICCGQVLQDRISGKYYFDVKYSEIKGSPYLYDDWRFSLITYSDGLQLKNVPLKFDLYSNNPLFLKNDSAFEFIKEIWEFVIYNPAGDSAVFRKGFSAIDNITPATYLQVMEEGKLVLLKYQPKAKTETKGFSSAVTVTEFTLYPPSLYLLTETKLVKVKRNDEAALKEIMKGEWENVAGFMKQNKLGLRKDTDITSLIRYYNSL